MWVLGDLSINQSQEMIEAAEGGGDHPELRAGIGPVETGEEPPAGVEIGDDIWRWLQRRSCLQPAEQARLEILEHRNFANILARGKLKRTPYLLHALDEPVAIKGHANPYGRSSRLASAAAGEEKTLSTRRGFAIVSPRTTECSSRHGEVEDMARECDIFSKTPGFGHSISHAHNVTNRRWTPNIQRVKVRHEGKICRIRICTRCLRSGKVEKVI